MARRRTALLLLTLRLEGIMQLLRAANDEEKTYDGSHFQRGCPAVKHEYRLDAVEE